MSLWQAAQLTFLNEPFKHKLLLTLEDFGTPRKLRLCMNESMLSYRDILGCFTVGAKGQEVDFLIIIQNFECFLPLLEITPSDDARNHKTLSVIFSSDRQASLKLCYFFQKTKASSIDL